MTSRKDKVKAHPTPFGNPVRKSQRDSTGDVGRASAFQTQSLFIGFIRISLVTPSTFTTELVLASQRLPTKTFHSNEDIKPCLGSSMDNWLTTRTRPMQRTLKSRTLRRRHTPYGEPVIVFSDSLPSRRAGHLFPSKTKASPHKTANAFATPSITRVRRAVPRPTTLILFSDHIHELDVLSLLTDDQKHRSKIKLPEDPLEYTTWSGKRPCLWIDSKGVPVLLILPEWLNEEERVRPCKGRVRS